MPQKDFIELISQIKFCALEQYGFSSITKLIKETSDHGNQVGFRNANAKTIRQFSRAQLLVVHHKHLACHNR